MRMSLTTAIATSVLAAAALTTGPAAAFDPAQKLPPKQQIKSPPLSPAQQAEADKLAKERLDTQRKAHAERAKAQAARDEELKRAKGVVKAPEKAALPQNKK